ncbi:MAG: chromosome segregation protein SMC [Ilumatobacteraceae bacterium]
MFLKRLTLKGFKSFAESTTLDLEPGVTVVVGPNGSGKSNVVDAISWVLGAQAPSAVRSQKMDDVIFAGTATRPALGRAEVTLTIDNSSGLLGLELTEVTVRRTLFRTGDSEYAINDVPCRLLDVQELLSDAGVGRQQHVVVGQGQIDAVLTARPEDRRAIIEEAAGVLKYRKRKEKAHRRLDATEASLLRVQDLLREVRRQLRPLERQAEAARRHDELVGELTGLRIHVAGRELAALRTRLTAAAAAKLDAAGAEAHLKAELARLDTEVATATAELTARGAEDVGDQLATTDQLRERARAVAAVVAERGRSLERDLGHALHADVVATLEAEAARSRAELDDVERERAVLEPELTNLDRDERTLQDDRDRLAAGVPTAASPTSAASAAAEVRGELRSRRAGLERTAVEVAQAAERASALGLVAVEAERRYARSQHDCQAAELIETPLVERIAGAEAHLADLEAQRVEAATAFQRAAEAAAASAGRVEALRLALDAVHAGTGADELTGVEGVVGMLLDLVRIDDGWDCAVEAALGEALTAVVARDPSAAADALRVLQRAQRAGAVLAMGLGAPAAAAPPIGDPVRPHVHADRTVVGHLLDRLLASATRIDDLEAAIDGACAHPDVVVVSGDGDRFGPAGWRIGVATAGVVTAAALDDATADAARHRRESQRCAAVEQVASERATTGRRHLEDLQAQLAAADAVLTSASEGLAAAQAQRREAVAELEPLLRRLDELRAHERDDAVRVAELEQLLPQLEAGEQVEADAVRTRAAIQAELEARASVLAVRRRDLDVRTAGLAERVQLLRTRLDEVELRLDEDTNARAEAVTRRAGLERSLVALDRLGRLVGAHRLVLDAHHGELAERRRQQSERVRALGAHLEAVRGDRTETERSLEAVRERARRAEVDEAEGRLRYEAAVELLRHDLDVEPETAEAAPAPPLPDGVTAQARARELEREVRLLGPINPLALEEFTELQQRHAFLEDQLDDVRSTRRDLLRVIRAVDEEIQSVFAAAYADVADNFERLFTALFPGGVGKLVLDTPEDLLETGVEIEAKPSGKNVKKLSLLSGGERSLTALAFLFAVFRSRPSPFYVMDEVEAALDDMNLHRFLGLVAEFRREAQLLVVSHQKRTMEAGDCLLGVTMQPGGSSRVITERVSAA